jgi:hypothetical protein
MSNPVNVTINVSLGTDSSGNMEITSPGATTQTDIWDGKSVSFTIIPNLNYPNAYLLAVELLDSNGNPSVNQSGPFTAPPAYNGSVQNRMGQVQAGISESSWQYRVWVYDGTHLASRLPGDSHGLERRISCGHENSRERVSCTKHIFLNQGPAGPPDSIFTLVTSAPAILPRGLLVEDLNGDRRPDVIVADSMWIAVYTMGEEVMCLKPTSPPG